MAKDLLEALDEAAQLLLAKAGLGVKVEGEVASTEASLAEQVKTFQAVADWANDRRELAPKQQVEAKFDAIRAKFNSAPTKRRRASAAAKEAAGSVGDDAGDDEPEVAYDA